MEAKDLMIEDWVQVPVECNRYKKIRSTFDMDDAILYKPIPLTEDILKENGFKFDGDAALCRKHVLIFYGDKEHGWEVNIDRDDLEPYGKSVSIHVKYVHELQHAMRLCGIKNEIVL